MPDKLDAFWALATVGAFAVCGVAVVAATAIMTWRARKRIISIEEIPSGSVPGVAIVLGARVWPSGRPSLMLEDRLATALDLYQQGCAKLLFLSGDDSPASNHEVTTMAEWLRARRVSEGDIVCDPAGRRTLLTMLHAQQAGIHSAFIVTQSFHLPRALWLAANCGIDAIGVAADRRRYPLFVRARVELRELGARLLALFESVSVRRATCKGSKFA
ncbi:MAG: SanA/YdcF family protein [Candidatus Sumerlaeaceae bacterium]